MGDKEQLEKVRDGVDVILAYHDAVTMAHDRKFIDTDVWELHLEDCLDQILSIPEICIKAEDQSSPETLIDEMDYGTATCFDFRWGVSACQKDMTRANFIKVIDKGGL